MMKRLLTALLLLPFAALAQNYNPLVVQGIVSPAPLSNAGAGGTGTCSFLFANPGDDMPMVTGDSLKLTVVLSNGVPNNVSPLAALGGSMASFFNWTYNAGTKTYTGAQNQLIPGGLLGIGDITVAYQVTVNSAQANPENGFTATVLPPAYTLGINSTGDDLVSSFTWTTFNIAGTVYNDVNGLTDNLVNGTGTNAGGLFAILVNSLGTVYASTAVAANGTYVFEDVIPGTYTVRISTTAGVVNSAPPAVALPAGWVNTGEGSAAAGDGTPNGITNTVTISLGGSSVDNLNFGIEERPLASTLTAANQTNPGGTTNATVPATTFGGTDFSGGIITGILITTFPTNATSVTINGTTYTSGTFPVGGVTVPTNAAGEPTQPILIDPVDGSVTCVFTYRTIDNANVQSLATASANVPFITVSVAGTVLNDIDGMTDNLVDGTGTNAGGLNAILVNNATGNVTANVAVAANGTFTFTNINGGNYYVLISTTAGVVNSAPPAVALPANWVNTGEGTTTAGDGNVNGQTNTFAVSTDVSGIVFGIEERPTAITNTATSQTNPGGTVAVTVTPTLFFGSDFSGGTITSILLTAFPTNATSMTVNGTSYTAATFPVGGITVPANASGQPTQAITVDPVDGNVTVTIPYRTIDNANVLSLATADINLPFATVSITGTVFNDVNGMTNSLVDGATGTNAGGLFAVLVNNATGTVTASAAVAANGTYSFTGINGGDYYVLISTTAGTVNAAPPAVALPSGWVHTGEGTAAAGDGTPNGITNTFAVIADVSGVNFGIEQPPFPSTITASSMLNPGKGFKATVPASTFGGSDSSGGIITSLTITAFPANCDTLVVNGVTYTAATFPVGGINVPTNAAGQPTQTIAVDPKDGALRVSIPYTVTDNAGKVSATTGQAIINFTEAQPDFNVTLANKIVSGNVSTNDVTPTGTTYGTPVAAGVNPSPSLPVMNSNGSYTFTTGVEGVYRFIVPVCPPAQVSDCPTELLTITVTAPGSVLSPPIANTDIAMTNLNTPVTLFSLANDNASLGNTLTTATMTITTQPANGTATVNAANGQITYTPTAGFVGNDTLYYQVCQNSFPITCATAMQIITVRPAGTENQTLAADDYKTVQYNVAATGNVLTNDTDPESNTQSVTPQTTTIAGKGTLVLNANGTYTFTPVSNFNGPVEFPYTVCDNGTPQACASATIHFLVVPPDVTPNITCSPNVTNGITQFNVTVRVTELNTVPTSGTITVLIPKDSRVTFVYNPALTQIGFTPLNNSVWTYSNANAFYHIFTTTSSIPASSFSTFGFVATFDPNKANGVYTMTSTINSGSGGEIRTNNNSDAESITYFNN